MNQLYILTSVLLCDEAVDQWPQRIRRHEQRLQRPRCRTSRQLQHRLPSASLLLGNASRYTWRQRPIYEEFSIEYICYTVTIPKTETGIPYNSDIFCALREFNLISLGQKWQKDITQSSQPSMLKAETIHTGLNWTTDRTALIRANRHYLIYSDVEFSVFLAKATRCTEGLFFRDKFHLNRCRVVPALYGTQKTVTFSRIFGIVAHQGRIPCATLTKFWGSKGYSMLVS